MSDTSRENTSERLPLPDPAAHAVGRPSHGDDELVLTDDNAQLFRALIQGATDFAVFKLDADGRVAAWNASAERFLGYRADEILGRDASIFFTAEDRAAGMPEQELRVARERGLSEDENWLVRKDGTRLWAGGQTTALLDAAGALLGFAKICRDRTQHKHADEATQRHAALLDLAYDAIFVHDPSNVITFWNRAAEELYGWSRAEAIGAVAHELLKTRFPVSLDEVRSRLEATGRWEGELIHTCRDGRELTVASRWAVQRDQAGRPVAVLEITRDVTEQKRVERALRESQERFQTVVDTVPQVIWCNRPDGSVEFFNRRWYELTGASDADAEGLRWTEYVHPDDRPAIVEHHDAGIRAGAPYEIEVRFRRGDGAYRWHFARVSPLHDEHGRVRAWYGGAIDVHGRKEAELALRLLADASEQLGSGLDYEATLKTVARLLVPDLADYCLIDVLGEDGRMRRLAAVHADPGKEPLLDMSQSYPPDLEAGTSPLAVALATGRSELAAEVTPDWLDRASRTPEHRRLVEELGPRSLMLVPLVARGQVLGLLSIVATDSGRCYTARDLRLAEGLARRCAAAIDNARLFRQAREAIRVRDDVLGGVSHDLKSPLTSISGMAQLLRRRATAADGPRDEPLATGLERIVATTARMSALIDELVDTARLELGQDVPLRREVTNLVELVEQAVAEQQRGADRHQIELERRVDRLVGLWDSARLRRVLDNLLGNAVKYSPDGGPIRVTLDRRADDDGPSAILTVSDRGVGIPLEDRPHVFERGRRGSNVGRISGAGIGLAGACQIVRQHGGDINVESEVGAGSAFTVRLPLARR